MKNTYDNSDLINAACALFDDTPQQHKRFFRRILRRAAGNFGLPADDSYRDRGEAYCGIIEIHPDLISYDQS